MLPPDAIPESSTYRELLGVYDFYNNELMMTHITTRMTQYDKQGLLHLLDSQAAVAILRKGASKSPECHRLVLQIYNKTRDLRVNHGLIFSWVPREQNRAADALSKMHDWCITPTAFQRLSKSVDIFNITQQIIRTQGQAPELSRSRKLAFPNQLLWVFSGTLQRNNYSLPTVLENFFSKGRRIIVINHDISTDYVLTYNSPFLSSSELHLHRSFNYVTL